MSLNFDLCDVRNADELRDETGLLPKYRNLILFLSVIGIGEITKKTIDVIFERVQVLEAIYGSLLENDDGQAAWYVREDVARLEGLKTNVFPKESDKTFRKKMAAIALEKMQQNYLETRKAPGTNG